MRKAFVFVFVFATGAGAYAQQPVQPQTQNVWMYGMPQTRLSMQNAAPWRCRMLTIAPGRKHDPLRPVWLGDLAPGETMFAGKDKQSLNPFAKPGIANYDLSSPLNIPIIAMYIDDNDRYIGAATGTFYIPGGGVSSVTNLIFKPQNIRFADDKPTTASPAPQKFDARAVHVPYFTADGTNTIVFVWNSSVPAHIIVNGSENDDLNLGDVKAYVAWSPMTVVITATDADGQLRTWSQGFPNQQYYGTWAQVFILGVNDLQ